MKALVLTAYNQPYQLKELEMPVAGKGQVLVRIMASGVNPLDIKIKSGQAAHAQTRLPAILGVDMAGIVEAVGEGVTGFRPGDEVYGLTGGVAGVQGSLAEYTAADARLLGLKPKNMTMRETSVLPLVFITAWEGLVDRACVNEGKTVLIHGGAGGVGHIAVQLAKAKGAEVFAMVDPEDNALMESYGAVPIDYKRLSVADYVKEYSSGKGFDIVFDTVGGSVLDASFAAVKRYTGHVVSALGWSTHSLAPLSFRSATYSGVFTLYPLISGEGREHHGEILKQAAKLIEAGKIIPRLDPAHYNPGSVEEAYTAVAQRKNKGKVVIDISGFETEEYKKESGS